jgi:alginate O-acetyltransferase complex protein AlgI
MLFSSLDFFGFFAVYFLFHLLIPRKYSVYLIICGSTVFYAWWRIDYVWIPYLLMAIAYYGVIWINRTENSSARRLRATVAIVLLFMPLAIFKYADFIYVDILGALFSFHDKILDVPLPLGVSFVTFTLTAFIVDTYKGRFPPNERPDMILAYMLFFPHLIAGPILRPIELIPQLKHPRRARTLWPQTAIAVFTVGLVKKLVIANQIADMVDAVYADSAPSAGAALLAIYGFSVQIYCDFSGYTDMAIGLAMLLGIRLPNNFRQPYIAGSLVDFWRRWHITLSYWLRDYLYIPLGGNKDGLLYTSRNILITMVLGGLWHGANWTFVTWGFLHGIGISAIHALRHFAPAATRWLPSWLSILLTFHVVALAWVFFRAPNFAKAIEIFSAVANASSPTDIWLAISGNIFSVIVLCLFFATHRYDDHRRIKAAMRKLRPELIWPVLATGWIFAIAVSQGGSAKFIYFDF